MKEQHQLILQEIGNLIRMARLKKGFTLKDLAEKSNISAATLSKIEKGETNLKMTTHARIAEALEVDARSLLVDNLKYNG